MKKNSKKLKKCVDNGKISAIIKLNKLRKTAQQVENEHSINGTINEIDEAYVEIQVEWGDWRHDHNLLDDIIAENFDCMAKAVEVTEDNGSDTYSAIHRYMLRELQEQPKPEKIKVVIKKVGEPAYEAEIENTLEAYQELVGGYIECISISNSVDMICNDEAKLIGLAPNISTLNDIICGDVVFVGVNGEDFKSLTDTQRAVLCRMFEGKVNQYEKYISQNK